jgi:hypothetical protein
VLLGAGTDASPTFAALFSLATDGGFRHQIVVDGASRYGWASFAWINTTGVPTHMLYYDPVTSNTTADVDPSVIYLNGTVAASANGGVAGAGVGQWESFTRNNSKLFGYSNGVWGATIFGLMLAVSNAGTYKNWSAGNAVADDDGKDNGITMPYTQYNTTTNFGMWKGFSSGLVCWSSVARVTGSTLTTSGTKDRVVLCDVSLPWNGTDTTI